VERLSSFRDTLSMAVESLWAHRLRSSLTVLGVLIGNASFVAMVGVSQGARNYLIDQLDSFGPNRLIVYSQIPDNQPFGTPVSQLTVADIRAIAEGAPAVSGVAPQISTDLWLTRGSRTVKPSVIGTSFNYPKVRNMAVESGRFFLPTEENSNAAVVILGATTASDLFGTESPINQNILINNVNFIVIGVMEKKGTFARFNPDKAAYIPITTMAIRLIGRQNAQGIPIDYADVSAIDKASIPSAIYQINNILRWRSGKEDFAIQTNQPFLDLIAQIGRVLTLFLGTVSGISLLVGGIGIMNVMLVTVAERTSEIGLRKAVGAKSSSILLQFLLEAVIMSTIGGAVGIVIGLAGSQAIGKFSPIKAPVPSWAIILSLGISGGVGVAFGIVPAKNAAKLDPIKALRSD